MRTLRNNPLTLSEVNGGRVQPLAESGGWRLSLPPARRGYANAQLDDYQSTGGPAFQWLPGTRLRLRARFSAGRDRLVGTAGFGFWNAPFGPGTGWRPRLPQAVWFFYASEASDLPLAPVDRPGNGWFLATIDATRARTLMWAILAAPAGLLNQIPGIRARLWPVIRRDLRISFERLAVDMRNWHDYEINWGSDRSAFLVDGRPLAISAASPRGPLGFVTWIDNQALVARPTGRVRWQTEAGTGQWMDVQRLDVKGGI